MNNTDEYILNHLQYLAGRLQHLSPTELDILLKGLSLYDLDLEELNLILNK